MLSNKFLLGENSGSVADELRYDFIRVIGRGTFSKVFEGRCRESGRAVALKLIRKCDFDYNCGVFDREVEAHIAIGPGHRHIVQLYDAYETQDAWILVMEHAENGDLFSLLHRHGRLTECECRDVMVQILRAMTYLHERRKLCHRDLKIENILFTGDGRVVVTDFGLSRQYRSKLLTRCGSEEYAAPEVILGKPYDAEKVDVWSFAVIMYACLKGHLPFQRGSLHPVNSSSPSSLYSQILEKPIALKGFSPMCTALLESLFNRDPSERPRFNAILRHRFFQ